MFKENVEKNPEAKEWIEFSQSDLDQQVKALTGMTIAFRVNMEFNIKVDGRGQSFQVSSLKVDPKDELDRTMRQKTHFWKSFMSGSTPRCLMMVSNKGQEEIEGIAPENFHGNFMSNGIFDKANVTLYEIAKIPQNVEDEEYGDEEGGEGGEEELNEMEEDNASMNDKEIDQVEPVVVIEEPPK